MLRARFILSGICVVVIFLSTIFSPAAIPQLLDCPFKLLTDKLCPLCGMTHAFAAIVRGDIALASKYNPLAIPLFFLVVLSAISPVVSDSHYERLRGPCRQSFQFVLVGLLLSGLYRLTLH
jgi:hypothetical protein